MLALSPLTLVTPAASAGPFGKKATEGAPDVVSDYGVLDIPGLRETLESQGWTPTADQSSMLSVGDVRMPDGTAAAYAEKCYPDVQARSGVKR